MHWGLIMQSQVSAHALLRQIQVKLKSSADSFTRFGIFRLNILALFPSSY